MLKAVIQGSAAAKQRSRGLNRGTPQRSRNFVTAVPSNLTCLVDSYNVPFDSGSSSSSSGRNMSFVRGISTEQTLKAIRNTTNPSSSASGIPVSLQVHKSNHALQGTS
jgi:hypothetical protein